MSWLEEGKEYRYQTVNDVGPKMERHGIYRGLASLHGVDVLLRFENADGEHWLVGAPHIVEIAEMGAATGTGGAGARHSPRPSQN